MRRAGILHVGMALATLAAVATVAAFAGPDGPFDLRWRPEPKAIHFYRTTVTVRESESDDSPARLTARIRERVERTEADGRITVVRTTQGAVLETGGRRTEVDDPNLTTIRRLPSGARLTIERDRPMTTPSVLSGVFPVVPEEPVRIGRTWTAATMGMLVECRAAEVVRRGRSDAVLVTFTGRPAEAGRGAAMPRSVAGRHWIRISDGLLLATDVEFVEADGRGRTRYEAALETEAIQPPSAGR